MDYAAEREARMAEAARRAQSAVTPRPTGTIPATIGPSYEPDVPAMYPADEDVEYVPVPEMYEVAREPDWHRKTRLFMQPIATAIPFAVAEALDFAQDLTGHMRPGVRVRSDLRGLREEGGPETPEITSDRSYRELLADGLEMVGGFDPNLHPRTAMDRIIARGGEFGGLGLVAAFPMAGAARAYELSRQGLPLVARGARPFGQRITEGLLEYFMRNPLTAGLAEVGLGSTFGLAGQTGREMLPEDMRDGPAGDVAEMLTGLAGVAGTAGFYRQQFEKFRRIMGKHGAEFIQPKYAGPREPDIARRARADAEFSRYLESEMTPNEKLQWHNADTPAGQRIVEEDVIRRLGIKRPVEGHQPGDMLGTDEFYRLRTLAEKDTLSKAEYAEYEALVAKGNNLSREEWAEVNQLVEWLSDDSLDPILRAEYTKRVEQLEVKAALDPLLGHGQGRPPGELPFLRSESERFLPEREGSVGTARVLDEDTYSRAVRAAEELMFMGAARRDPSMKISDQIMSLLQTNRIDPERFTAVLQANNLSAEQFAQIWRRDINLSARRMQQLSVVEQRLKSLKAGLSPKEERELNDLAARLRDKSLDPARRAQYEARAEELKLRAADWEGEGAGTNAEGMGWWRRVENLRRGILVSRWSTAMRNASTQLANLTIQGLEKSLEQSILQRFPDAAEQRAKHPVRAFEEIIRVFSRGTKAEVDEILGAFPKQEDKLFLRYSSDVMDMGAGSKLMQGAENVVRALNVVNRFQEFTIRRGVFRASLDRRLAQQGDRLEDVLRENRVADLDEKMLSGAIDDALEATWAKEFSPHARGAEGVAGRLIQGITGTPLSSILPFPRFMMNAIRWQWQHSPLGMMKLAWSPEEWAKIAQGDLGTLTKGITGTALFLSALQLRRSEFAGGRWYQIQNPETGEPYDMRPFNPFAFYLFAADVYDKATSNRLYNLSSRDVVQGLMSANMRAGAGLYLVDKMIDSLYDVTADPEAWRDFSLGFAGQYASSFAVPLSQLKDIVAHFDEQETVLRDTREDPFWGPFAGKLPYADRGYPEVELATRGDPPHRVGTLRRMATGIGSIEVPTRMEDQLNRLGFSKGEIAPSSGIRELDRVVLREMGEIVDRFGEAFIMSPGYQQMPSAERAYWMTQFWKSVRTMARDEAEKKQPALFVAQDVARLPRRFRAAFWPESQEDIERLLELDERMQAPPAEMPPMGE